MSKTSKPKTGRTRKAASAAPRRTPARAQKAGAPKVRARTKTPSKKPLAQKLASAKPIVVKPARKARPSAQASKMVRPQASKTARRRAPVPRTASRKAAPPKAAVKKPAAKARAFRPEDFIVYPGHGVGRIKEVETLEVGGLRAEVFVLTFPNMMLVRVPVNNAS